MTKEEFLKNHPNIKIFGYRNGFVYIKILSDIYRGDVVDFTAWGWYSTAAGFESNVRAYGSLYDENGEEIQ